MPNYSAVINKVRTNKAHVLVFIVGLFCLTLGLLSAYHTIGFNSDDVSQKLLVHQTAEVDRINIFTPPDPFIWKLPINIVVDWLVNSPNKNLFISAWLMNALGLLMFFLAGLYFLRKYDNAAGAKWLFWLAFLWLCSNSSGIFLYDIRSPQIRNLEIGLAFLLLWGIDKLVLAAQPTTRRKKLTPRALLLAVFASLLFYSDPAFLIFLIVPIVIAGCLSYRQSQRHNLLRLGMFVLVSLAGYAVFNKAFDLLGIHVYKAPSNFVAWESLGHNLSIATQGLLSLHNAMIFGLPLLKVGTLIVVANLLLLMVAAIYIPRKLAAEKDYWLIFFAIQPLFLFSAYSLSNNVVDVATSRYLILLPFYIVLIVAIGFHRYWGARNRTVTIIAGCLLGAACLGQVVTNLGDLARNRHDNPNAYASQVAATIKSSRLTKGYATYWNAGINSFYSDYSADIFPVICDPPAMRPYYWVVNEALLKDLSKQSFIIVSNSRAHPGSEAESSFQASSCTDSNAISQFGQPAEVKKVTDYTEIFIYDYDLLTKMPARANPQTP